MSEYNDRWTREKFIEYRKLKKSGWNDRMLIEHFGEDIYHSGLYNRRSSILPWLNFLTEITITPEQCNYRVSSKPSDFFAGKSDWILEFNDNGTDYVICLFFYFINEIENYNILLTTKNQWNEYQVLISSLITRSYVTDLERKLMVEIVERQTNLNQVYSVMKKVSYIIKDFISSKLPGVILSIGETSNPAKINLYRNIIKNSFPEVQFLGDIEDDDKNKYFLYQLS